MKQNSCSLRIHFFTSWESDLAVSGLFCIMLAALVAPVTVSCKIGLCLFEARTWQRTEQRLRATVVSSAMAKACHHIVMAAAAAPSVHTPHFMLLPLYFFADHSYYHKHCSSRWTSLQGPAKWNTIQKPPTELHLKLMYFVQVPPSAAVTTVSFAQLCVSGQGLL